MISKWKHKVKKLVLSYSIHNKALRAPEACFLLIQRIHKHKNFFIPAYPYSGIETFELKPFFAVAILSPQFSHNINVNDSE